MKNAKPSVQFQRNLDELSTNLPEYLKKTRDIPDSVFTGPSFHFHERAIEEAKKEFLGPNHLEMIYAVLPAWGMHRMGDTKAKVINYRDFKCEIEKPEVKEKLIAWEKQGATILSVDVKEIAKMIFDIHVSESKSQIVSSSKTLHHILPELFPPIDRAYSMRFMKQSHDQRDKNHFDRKTITIYAKNSKKSDEENLKKSKEKEDGIAREFITAMKEFIERPGHKNEMEKAREFSKFNTSLPKIFDNLIVAFIRDKRVSEKTSDTVDGDEDE